MRWEIARRSDNVEDRRGLRVKRGASAIGDDRLQRETRGRVVPDRFTHHTSAQRVSWFRRGFESGDLARCDTFASREF